MVRRAGIVDEFGGRLCPDERDDLSIIAVMIVAIATVHWGHGLLAPAGIELPLLYLTAAFSLALTGPGVHSLDALLGLTPWWTSQITVIVLATGVVGGLVSLGIRRLGPAMAHA